MSTNSDVRSTYERPHNEQLSSLANHFRSARNFGRASLAFCIASAGALGLGLGNVLRAPTADHRILLPAGIIVAVGALYGFSLAQTSNRISARAESRLREIARPESSAAEPDGGATELATASADENEL